MKITGFICCALAFTWLTESVKSERLQEKIEQQLLDRHGMEDAVKMKRPFCNAFTGCGRKRSLDVGSVNSLAAAQNVRFPIPFYRALLRAVAEQETQEATDRESINDYRTTNLGRDYEVYLARKFLPRDNNFIDID